MTERAAGPRGWRPGLIEHREQRLADTAAVPLTYDEGTRSVDAVLSKGSPVARFYGREVLRIDPQSVKFDRLVGGGIPLLNSHVQGDITASFGRVNDVWFNRGSLMGRLQFHQTRAGKTAEGMVRRGEVGAISIGYRVEEWQITDPETGDIIDPDRVGWDDDFTFTATRWELLEASLVCVPADADASIRSLGGGNRVSDTRVRMMARQRMTIRQAMSDRQSVMFGDHDD